MDDRKRICVIAPEIGSGGVEAVLLNYFFYIDRDKFHLDLLTYEITNIDRKNAFESLGFRIIKIPKKKEGFINSVRAMSSIIKREKYDVVHAHMTMWNCIPMFLAWKWKVPIRISHSHLAVTLQSVFGRVLLILQRAIINSFATKLCACGEAAGRYLYGNRAYKENKVLIINNAIDVEKFHRNPLLRDRIRRSLKIPDSTFCIGHIGRFHEHKNHAFLIDIFEEVCKRQADSRLILVGDGGLKNTICKMVKDKNLESKVMFLGVRSDPEMVYQVMDVFCLPSLFEGLPVVGIEAQAAGVPCVFSNNISDKVLITKLSQSIDLSQSAKYWADVLIAIKSRTTDELFPKEYDIKEMASVWEEMYL